MKIHYFLFLLLPFLSFSQVQIGETIFGKTGGENFGSIVCLSADGNTFAASSPDKYSFSNAQVRIYNNINNEWTQIGNDIIIEEIGEVFSISLSADGNTVAAGAHDHTGGGFANGQVRVFKNINNTWTQIGQEINGDDFVEHFGYSVSLSSDASILAIGSTFGGDDETGYVRIYKNINNTWTQIGQDIDGEAPYDTSGYSIDLSDDGSVVAIGAPLNGDNGQGHVRVYKNINNIWTKIGQDIDGNTDDHLGGNVCLSADGSILAISGNKNYSQVGLDGLVRIYKNINNQWVQISPDFNNEGIYTEIGKGLSISSDGSIVAIGAETKSNNISVTKIYKNSNNVWTQVGVNISSEIKDGLGMSVSLSDDGSVIALGGPHNNEKAPDNGCVKVYDLTSVLLSTESFTYDYFTYYPNPVTNELNINLEKGYTLKQVNIYNIQSQYLYSEKGSKIDVSNLASGMYFIEVETNKGKSAKKIIVE